MMRVTLWTIVPLGLVLGASPLAAQGHAQGQLSAQDPASAQPTLPKPMSDLKMTVPGANDIAPKAPTKRNVGRHHDRLNRYAHDRSRQQLLDRPVLANVELLEPLPHPPQPPHVVVPVPGYPLDNFVTYYTAPPPPVVCHQTGYDRFKPDPRLVDEKPVLCTADNP